MRTILFIFLLSVFTIANAQHGSFTTLKDIAIFKQKFTAASFQLQSVESDFVQIKNLSMLKDNITSHGKFFYKKGNKVRIEYVKPFSYLMVLNNDAMMVMDEHKKSTFNTRSNKMMQSINNIMMDCMSGNVYNNKEFSINVMENAKEYMLTLTPSTSMMKKMFSRIEVYLSKTDYNVLRLNMIEKEGDNSLMTFTNRVINKTLDEKLFSTK
jgi:outer membrane lipoprotein-sorting protein